MHNVWIAIFMRASVFIRLYIPLCVHHMDMCWYSRTHTQTHTHAQIPTHTNASLCVCARVSYVAIRGTRIASAVRDVSAHRMSVLGWSLATPLSKILAIRIRGHRVTSFRSVPLPSWSPGYHPCTTSRPPRDNRQSVFRLC